MHFVASHPVGAEHDPKAIHHQRICRAIFLSGALACVTACGGRPADSGTVKLDLTKIFPPGQGRELVLGNCQNCHTFAPIVLLQMDKEAWHRNSLDHRERVTTLSEEEFAIVYSYLTANFGPDHPVPQLPKEFLKSWTSY
jgi:mono/diheme cytochrome c family protein